MSLCALLQASPPEKESAKESAKEPVPSVKPITRDAEVTIAGQSVPYVSTTGKIQLKQADGKVRASVFYVSYERRGDADRARRPVLFAFNGGPGSSSVWLHLGLLGPKIVELPQAGAAAATPPTRVTDNPQSLLDVCDLVLIDPVSTGYSRAENDVKESTFHGLTEDIESMGDFIRRWINDHDRWAAPKYLLGESYGGVRAAGLAQHLQSRYGMALNGVILMSSLLDFGTLRASSGHDLSYQIYLPAFTGVAHFHGKISGDRDARIEESRQYAFGEYAAVLLQGESAADGVKQRVAARLEELTGIEAAAWRRHALRMEPTEFRAELLRSAGKIVGRFDGRVVGFAVDPAAAKAEGDPSFDAAYQAFSPAMMDYLAGGLGYKEEQPYEILTDVGPWRWNADNNLVHVGPQLAAAMRANPHLRVLVMSGRNDLATPAEGMAYSIRHLRELTPDARARIAFTHYDAGHMFYLNPPDRAKARNDLLHFITMKGL